MISLPVKITTVYSSCLLNLGNCLLLFINKVTLKTGDRDGTIYGGLTSTVSFSAV